MKKTSFFQKVGTTPIIPISAKIILIFTLLLLFSNFATNYISILLSRKETVNLTNQLLVRELKELSTNASNQNKIFLFSGDKLDAMLSLSASAQRNMLHPHSWALGVTARGELSFKTVEADYEEFPDHKALTEMIALQEKGVSEGARFFNTPEGEYFGVYKYNEDWGLFLVRADLMADMLRSSNQAFFNVGVIIVCLTVFFVIVGFIAFLNIMRFIGKISAALYQMQRNQDMELIDLTGATNDDVTYLGVSFNALSSTINNLLAIFRKFTSQDMVTKAYKNRFINLEGEQRELAILFSDIRSFTYMTETLGNDIINLLNLHYDSAINVIHTHNGIIGSIIGDAVLAVYGSMEREEVMEETGNKSLDAVNSAWALTDAALELRERMHTRRKEIEVNRPLTATEEAVFKAVLLDIGVGIDGGTVFYGTIGSSERMTNTVIGDNVNSSSRLEALTRVYPFPIIVSSYVMDEVLETSKQYRFFEIDTVQVKGKVEGKKIWFPLDTKRSAALDIEALEVFEQGLKLYYAGDWPQAISCMERCTHKVAQVFLARMEGQAAPEGWDGIWKMTSK